VYCVHILKKPYLFQCFVFHLYKGVRAGGGIGDEIEPPDGDDYEVYRILFDITFFFFVIVILLAIIQGKKLNCKGNILASLQQSKSQFSYPISLSPCQSHQLLCDSQQSFVKLSLYRPGQTLGLQEVEAPRMSRELAHEGGKVVNPRHCNTACTTGKCSETINLHLSLLFIQNVPSCN